MIIITNSIFMQLFQLCSNHCGEDSNLSGIHYCGMRTHGFMESTRCYDIAFIVGEIPNVPRIGLYSPTPIQLDCKTEGEVLDNQQGRSECGGTHCSTQHPHNWTRFDQQIEL
jgi:hypothetical protein